MPRDRGWIRRGEQHPTCAREVKAMVGRGGGGGRCHNQHWRGRLDMSGLSPPLAIFLSGVSMAVIVKLVLINTRSIKKNKTLLIHNLIMDENRDLGGR